jgi:hypothetical protein
MIIVPLGLLLLLAGSAAASPLCGSGAVGNGLDAFIANYAGFDNACLIGDKLFYNFDFKVNGGTVTPNATGAGINITADATSPVADPGLRIQTGEFFLFAGQTLDVTITYSVATASGSALIEDYGLVLAGGNGNTNGVGTVTESFSNAGPLTAGFGPGAAGVSGAHLSFTPFIVGTTVSTHIQENAGTGQIDVSYIQENFSEVIPEPYAAVLIGSGLVLLGLRRKRAA